MTNKRNIYFRHEELRKQQKKLIEDTYKAIKEKKNLIAHAPTGLGKTDAIISSAITHSLKTGETVFFTTPKISQHEIALEVVRDLNRKYGLNIRATDVVGKKHLCPNKPLKKAPSNEFYELCKKQKKEEKCPYYARAVGHTKKEKIKAKNRIEEFLEWQEKGRTNTEIIEHIEEMQKPICGYEATIEASKKSDVIICDYFHVLNPFISQTFLQKTNKELKNSILIIDEAHNAPSRIRSSLSTQIGSYTFKKAKKEAIVLKDHELKKEIDNIEKKVKKKTGRLRQNEEKLITKNSIPIPSKETRKNLEKIGTEYMEKSNKDKSSCLSMKKFYDNWTKKSKKKSFARIMKKWDKGKGFSIQYKCLDPSIFTEKIVNKTRSTVLMSGTMKPQKMYRDLTGLDKKKTKLKEYESPFPEKNQLKIIVPNVTTKYSERTPQQYEKIAEKTSEITQEIPGNTAVFFPSYKVMRKVQRHLEEKINKPIVIQEKEYTQKENNKTLEEFKKHSKSEEGALLAAVSGGSYGEGIDLPGKQLMGAIIVGIPLNKPDLETKSLIKYYDHKYGKGWEYGYIFPAMTKAIQAAGRCIRNEEDKGIIAYLDNRYTWRNYSRCFPEEKNMKVTEEPGEIIRDFWIKN